MTCSEFIDGFSEYYDGVGDSAFLEAAEAHLEACEACRRYHEVFDRGRALLRAFPRVDVSDDFRPRLRHRLYHVEDGDALSPGSAGSATTAGTALGMALLLVMAAWAPVLWSEPAVDLAPIVVTEPAPRPVRLQVRPVSLVAGRSGASFETTAADLWEHSNVLLFRHSRLSGRRPVGTTPQRAGLD